MNSRPLGEFDVYINDGNYGEIYPEKEDFRSSGVPFISASDFIGQIFNYENIKYISHDLHSKVLKKGHLKLNDIVIVVRGNGIGKVGFFKDDIGECNINAQLAFIRTNPNELDARFLYYLFSSKDYFELIRKFGSGSAQPQLPINRLKLVPVLHPRIEEQRQIGRFLGEIDNKVSINNRINAELEAMAKTIYDYWFVQFDFPISKEQAKAMDKPKLEGKPYKANGGKMVWSEELKIEIPAIWKAESLTKIIEFNPTISLPKGTEASYIDMDALPQRGFMTKVPIKKAFHGGMKFQNGDVAVARITPCLENGKTGLITLLKDGEFGFGSTEFIILRGRKSDLRSYASCLARSVKFRAYAISKMTGTSGRKRVSASDLQEFLTAIPDDDTLNRFELLVSCFFEKMTLNALENQKLAELRDWLLPMLMNGQIRITGSRQRLSKTNQMTEGHTHIQWNKNATELH